MSIHKYVFYKDIICKVTSEAKDSKLILVVSILDGSLHLTYKALTTPLTKAEILLYCHES